VALGDTAPGRKLRSLFVLGAPRCGTTFVSRLLARHPQICFSKPKEPHFFVRAGARAPSRELAERYLRAYFSHLRDSHRVLAEGSPSYLYDPDVPPRLLELDPDASFVVCVRSPIEMAPSYHARLVYTLDEDVADFGTAWSLQGVRARGERLPRRCRDPRMLQYRAVCSLGDQLARLFSAVGRERCFLVVFDDLVGEPARVHEELLRFAGVDPAPATFKRKRENRVFKRAWLQSLLLNPPGPLSWVIARWEERGWGKPPPIRALRRRIRRWNTSSAPRPPLAPAAREMLRAAFAEDVERLASLLRRDLSHWR
jgi:hypothetical protein